MEREFYKLNARPSFLEGVARLFDFSGWLNQYNYSDSEEEADYRALESDWQNVGEDIRQAIRKYQQLLEEFDD